MRSNTITSIVWALALSLSVACGVSKVGSTCEENGDCADLGGGYCAKTGICVTECAPPGDVCPADSACVPAYRRMVCLPRCDGDADCRPGESCTPASGASVNTCVITDPFAPPP